MFEVTAENVADTVHVGPACEPKNALSIAASSLVRRRPAGNPMADPVGGRVGVVGLSRARARDCVGGRGADPAARTNAVRAGGSRRQCGGVRQCPPQSTIQLWASLWEDAA